MSELRERIVHYLANHTVFNLATSGPAGVWASAVLYVHEGTTLYFTSVAATRHGQNMLSTDHVAGTISDECHDYLEMRGLQLEGTVALVSSIAERARIIRSYLVRFPFAAGLWPGQVDPEDIARDPGIHELYRITPSLLLFTDHTHAPGQRMELREAA